MMKRVHISVQGRVQGVYYRYYTQEEALRLGLTGWAKNLPDRSVEILAEGPEECLKTLVEWCRQGSPGARVDGVETTWGDYRGEFEAFKITY